MAAHTSDSEEILQYNIAITRCLEVNNCIADILFSLKSLQSKFTNPTNKAGKTKINQKHSKQVNKSDVQIIEKGNLSRSRSLHLILHKTGDFILKCIQIRRDIEGTLRQLEIIRQKFDQKIRFCKTFEKKEVVYIGSNSICKCLSREKNKIFTR